MCCHICPAAAPCIWQYNLAYPSSWCVLVSENEIEENNNVIKCKRAASGCETGWVSESCISYIE